MMVSVSVAKALLIFLVAMVTEEVALHGGDAAAWLDSGTVLEEIPSCPLKLPW